MEVSVIRFEEAEPAGSRSFFTEIIASISDIKFARGGRYILSRDYMTLKVCLSWWSQGCWLHIWLRLLDVFTVDQKDFVFPCNLFWIFSSSVHVPSTYLCLCVELIVVGCEHGSFSYRHLQSTWIFAAQGECKQRRGCIDGRLFQMFDVRIIVFKFVG